MKSSKLKKITDEIIGIDDKICSCSSIVGDIIISEENKKGKTSLGKIMDSLRKKKQEKGKNKE